MRRYGHVASGPGTARLGWRGAVLCAGLLIGGGAARADRIVYGQTTLQGVRIINLDGARVAYRTPGGDLELIDYAGVVRLHVDTVSRMRDLNEAEALVAQGEHARALVHYERALRLAESFWVRLVRARMIQACAAAGRMDMLTAQYVKLLSDESDGLALAAELLPDRVSNGAARGAVRATKQIDAVIGGLESQSARVLLEMLRYQLVDANDAGRADGYARTLAWQPIPPKVASRGAYRIKADALQRQIPDGRGRDVVAEVDRAMLIAPYEVLPELLLVKARALLHAASNEDDLVRVGWAAMRIVLHYPDDPRTPEALMVAAKVHERIGRAPTALKLLGECIGHRAVTADLRRQAEADVERLRTPG